MKLLILVLLGAGAYMMLESMSIKTVAGLPPDAVLATTQTVLGANINIYLASTGYYAVLPLGANSNKILGPASQAQIQDLLRVQSLIGSI